MRSCGLQESEWYDNMQKFMDLPAMVNMELDEYEHHMIERIVTT